MDDAVWVRDAAESALADVEPELLRRALLERLADAEVTPGVLTLVSARALDPEVDPEGLGERAAGVQLIYEGLRLTRRLAHEEPWTDADLDRAGDIAADLEVLAADVSVARGFYLLARSPAASKAVETVRDFGRDQTRARADGDPTARDRNLEADVFELAVVAGTTAVGGTAPDELLAYAADLARETDGREMLATDSLPDAAGEEIAALAERDRVASSADP